MGTEALGSNGAAQEAAGVSVRNGSAGGSQAPLEPLVELLPPEYTRAASLVKFRVAAVPKALGGEFLKLLQAHAPLGPEFIHLKRVRSALPPAPQGNLQVLVCSAHTELPKQVVDFLEDRSCDPCCTVDVPRDGALTRKQLADFSVHWPLTFRKPSFEPLELDGAAHRRYANWLGRAVEVGSGKCGCIIVDKSGNELAAAADETDRHPLRHSVMAAIDMVAQAQLNTIEECQQGQKRPRAEEHYLCQECEVITSHEPCIMCAMALVHSRVRLVAYHLPDPHFGGLGGKVSLHTCQNLNHQFRVLHWRPQLNRP